MAENCAESPMTLTPQSTETARNRENGPPTAKPIAMAQPPKTNIMEAAANLRPNRSASTPPSSAPSAPEAITTKVVSEAALAP